MKMIKEFVKKEVVLVVAMALAVVSMFIVTPDKEYVEYVDFRTLSILFCLMGGVLIPAFFSSLSLRIFSSIFLQMRLRLSR